MAAMSTLPVFGLWTSIKEEEEPCVLPFLELLLEERFFLSLLEIPSAF
jgi:hypothetical protein